MAFLTALWLPILLTGIVLFFASFVAWTILPHHQRDWDRAPDEPALLDAVRKLNLPAGSYLFPYFSHQEAKDPANQERYRIGPRGRLDVWDEANMGRNLGLTFLHFLLVAIFTAYIGWIAMEGTAPTGWHVFRLVGAVGVLTFASSGQLHAIWFRRRTLNDFLDGIVYGLLMGLIFAICWPKS
ncbi:MAG TPA: hypothetical protein PKD54_07340 [Pirellulaceae bacterium]|nr:hypothetical protein [Pirellulaceae bacterium]